MHTQTRAHTHTRTHTQGLSGADVLMLTDVCVCVSWWMSVMGIKFPFKTEQSVLFKSRGSAAASRFSCLSHSSCVNQRPVTSSSDLRLTCRLPDIHHDTHTHTHTHTCQHQHIWIRHTPLTDCTALSQPSKLKSDWLELQTSSMK